MVAAAKRAGTPSPPMPVCDSEEHAKELHREIYPYLGPLFEACVARPVNRQERMSNPKALAAIKKEWDRLRDIKCWDESRPAEWSDISRWYRDKALEAHVGRIFDILVEKGSELSEDDPARKYKGRVAF